MTGTIHSTEERDVLDVFAAREDPSEPLSTSEVAAELDCTHRTAYNRLDALAERGVIETKRIGARARRPRPNRRRRRATRRRSSS